MTMHFYILNSLWLDFFTKEQLKKENQTRNPFP